MNHNAVELRRQNLVYFGVEWFENGGAKLGHGSGGIVLLRAV